MFPLGVKDHPEFYDWMNQLHLDFFQISEARFNCHSRNRMPFNRIFAVVSAGKRLSRLFSHSDNTELWMKPGSINFISCLTDLEFEFHDDTRFFAFHFNIQAGQRDLFAEKTLLLQRGGRMETVRRLKDCFAADMPDPRSLWTMESILCNEIAFFLPSDGRMVIIDSERWKKVFEYIHEKADASTSIADLAAIYQDTADRFSRIFSREFHITAKHYLEMELVRRAGKQLLLSSKTVKEIADEMKFSDEYYFSRFFRKNTGVAPGQYRRQNRLLSGGSSQSGDEGFRRGSQKR